MQPAAMKLTAAICALMSVAIVFAQVTLVVQSVNLSPFYWALHSKFFGYGFLELFSFFIILYMALCTFTSLAKMRLFRDYKLVKHHGTDALSLLFYTRCSISLTAATCASCQCHSATTSLTWSKTMTQPSSRSLPLSWESTTCLERNLVCTFHS
jgi:hypothetical protein